MLLERSWIRKDYVLSHVTAAHCTPRGNLILCKPQFAHKVHITYRSKMNVREAIIAEVNMANGAKLFIAAVHLRAYEQYPESRDVEFTQLCKAIEQFKKLEDGVVILGDFNLHAKEEGQIIRAPYVDLWSEIHPNEEGYTFDYRANKLIPYLFPPERVRRYRSVPSGVSNRGCYCSAKCGWTGSL
jgi:endonuclease/exonuclease/phosphatase family metal-dependent hydrolase